MYSLPADQMPNHFAYSETESLSRILANGRKKLVQLCNGQHLEVVLAGERLKGADIAWALRFGRWPKFPLVNISGNAFDLEIGRNIFPARLRVLRYRSTDRYGRFYHPLSDDAWFYTEFEARRDWNARAAAWYRSDLQTVLDIEGEESSWQRRAEAERFTAEPPESHLPQEKHYRMTPRQRMVMARRPVPSSQGSQAPRMPDGSRRVKPKKPSVVPAGKAWHYFQGEWMLLPIACHVSDDIKVRALAVKGGAVRFEYHPDGVKAFMFDGSEYKPAQ